MWMKAGTPSIITSCLTVRFRARDTDTDQCTDVVAVKTADMHDAATRPTLQLHIILSCLRIVIARPLHRIAWQS